MKIRSARRAPLVTSSGVSGRFRPDSSQVSQVVALVDGEKVAMAHTVPAEDGELRFELTLPPHILGGWLDVIAVETGHSVLAGEVDLAFARGLRWGSTMVRGRRISGSFGFDGPAAPDGSFAVPIAFVDDGVVYGQGFAIPERRPDGTLLYRFTVELTRMPPGRNPIEVSPRVGGIPVRERLRVEAAAFRYAGFADPGPAPRAEGWAVDLDNPRRRVKLELRINGRVVASGVADRMRQDVRDLGLSDGRSGFVIPFPRGVPHDRDLRLEVVIEGTGLNLSNSPYVKPAAPPYVGFFDSLEGPYAGGWIIDMYRPKTPVQVEAICGGEVIGRSVADLHRGDVAEAGLPSSKCGFRFQLERPLSTLFGRDIYLHIAGTEHALAGSPRQVVQNPNITRFLGRARAIPAAPLARLGRRITYATRNVGISIIMPVHETPRAWLVEALASVQAQWSANWELICVDDGSRQPHVRKVLDAFAAADRRIRVLHSPANRGIAASINLGLRAARGNYVAFMDHDDAIEPDAVYRLAQAALETGADLVYSDEVLTGADINAVIEVRGRPAFSHDFYLSHPYFVHMVCVRTAIARQLAGWDENLPISADVDFVLRAIEQAQVVAHVPRVLYRWRTHESSTGHAKRAQVMQATKAAIGRHLARLGRTASVRDGAGYNEYRIDWPDDGGEVLIVIPTKDRVDLLRTCINSIERTAPASENYRIVVIDHQSTDPRTVRYLADLAKRHTVMPYEGAFNYARMNNRAVRQHGGRARYVLFCNNDIEARATGWLTRLRSLAARPEVGAVGPLLLYGNGRVQHAGVLVGFSGAAEHAMKFSLAYAGRDREPGYNCNLTSTRDYSAVTAACMMVRRDALKRVRGFDERFAVGFNDTDLCLRLGEAGYKILYDGHTVLYHHESATRAEHKSVEHPEDDDRLRTRWSRFFTVGDPFYNPLLAPSGPDHTLRTDTGCEGRMGARTVNLRPIAGPERRTRRT